MAKCLLLVDLENVHKIDLSLLDEHYSAIVYVGAKQNPPKAANKNSTAHRFRRVEFVKIEGGGKNALDFHIACQLGRTFETARETECFVLSKDKGFDPLLAQLNKDGLKCRRVSTMEELVMLRAADTVCPRCHKRKTIELHGGRWCSNCANFATPPDPALLPSNQPEYQHSNTDYRPNVLRAPRHNSLSCGWCHRAMDMSDGIYDDGEWMCGDCIFRYVSEESDADEANVS
ncbi:MAG: PIN domain-containing protein [Betaproteobacteria bacterium]